MVKYFLAVEAEEHELEQLAEAWAGLTRKTTTLFFHANQPEHRLNNLPLDTVIYVNVWHTPHSDPGTDAWEMSLTRGNMGGRGTDKVNIKTSLRQMLGMGELTVTPPEETALVGDIVDPRGRIIATSGSPGEESTDESGLETRTLIVQKDGSMVPPLESPKG